MANKWIPKAFLALWMLLLITLGGYYVFLAPREEQYSSQENRTLAAFPAATPESLLSGDFGEAMEAYLLDRFPGRSAVVSAVSFVQSRLSFATHEEYLMIAEGAEDPLDSEVDMESLNNLLGELTENTEPPETEPSVPETLPPETEPTATEPVETIPQETEPVEDPPIEKKPAATLADYDFTPALFMDRGDGPVAVMAFDRANVAAFSVALNKFAQCLPENGKLMFSVGISSYIVNRYANSSNLVSFYGTWDEIINGLSDDNVYAFDTAEILDPHIKDGAYVSFRTDNHWTPYGAYLVYREMVARAGKIPCDYYEDFEHDVEEPFRGNYVRDNPTEYRDVQPDTLELLVPKIPVEYRKITGKDTYTVIKLMNYQTDEQDRYTIYMSGPGGPWRYMECDNDQTDNCLVITDSFGMTMMPFLAYNYKQVHYYDARHYQKGVVGYSIAEMIEKYNIQDIYVVVADFHTFKSGFILTDAVRDLGLQ